MMEHLTDINSIEQALQDFLYQDDIYGCFNVMEQRQITRKHFYGIVRQPFKGTYKVRRTVVLHIGMVMVWRRTWLSVLSGMS